MLRVATVYLFLMAAVRLLGKRMSGQVSNVELGVMLTLGAIVAVPMVTPQRGVTTGLSLLICVVAFQQAVSVLQSRSPRVERVVVGRVTRLLADGKLMVDELEHSGISKQQLFSVLRAEGVRQLGELERVYLEAHGCFTVLHRDPPEPGLSILPSPADQAAQPGADIAPVCGYCGQLSRGGPAPLSCDNCGRSEWQKPVQPSNG